MEPSTCDECCSHVYENCSRACDNEPYSLLSFNDVLVIVIALFLILWLAYYTYRTKRCKMTVRPDKAEIIYGNIKKIFDENIDRPISYILTHNPEIDVVVYMKLYNLYRENRLSVETVRSVLRE